MQLSLDRAVAVGLDDAGREVGIPVCWHDETEVHEAAQEEFEVLEAVEYITGCDAALYGGFTLVVFEAGANEFSLGVCEPFTVLGEVRDEEEPGK